MTKTNYLCQEKKEKENSTTLKITCMDLYENSKTTLKRPKKDLLQWPEFELGSLIPFPTTITVTLRPHPCMYVRVCVCV